MKKTTKWININTITNIDRLPINPTVLPFVNGVLRGDNFPPIHLQKLSKGRFKLLDGRHRLLAHKLAGKKVIWAKYSEKESIYCQGKRFEI